MGFPGPVPRYAGFLGPVSPWATLGFPGPQSDNSLDFGFFLPKQSSMLKFSWPGTTNIYSDFSGLIYHSMGILVLRFFWPDTDPIVEWYLGFSGPHTS